MGEAYWKRVMHKRLLQGGAHNREKGAFQRGGTVLEREELIRERGAH